MRLNGFKTGLVFGFIADLLFLVFFLSVPIVAPLKQVDPATIAAFTKPSGSDLNFTLYFLGYFVSQPILMGLIGKWLIKKQ